MIANREKDNSNGIFRPLTPNTPLIHTWFTYSIWNMGEIYGLNFYLIYVHTSQKNLLKSLHAQKVSFLLLNLHF
jgi:hypothetical protein